MTRKFRLLVTSDVHGVILSTRYSDGQKESMGLAKIASLFDKYRDENTLCIDNGDLIQGSSLTFYTNQYYPEEINPVTKVVQKIGYDYINLGNHDFNFGINALKTHLQNVKAQCLTNNVKVQGEDLAPLYVVHTFPNGIKIALFGITTQFLVQWEKKETLKDLEVHHAFENAKKAVQEILANEKVDAIVGVYHGGFEKDLKSGEATERLTDENVGYKLCKELELDILITGHQHRSISGQCCGVLVSQTAQQGKEVALIDFDVDTKHGEVQLLKPEVEEDASIVKDLDPVEKEFQEWLDQPLGKASQSLKIEDRFQARLHKHPVVSFMNQVQLEKTQADFSAVALFNEAEGFNQVITMRDIVSTYVYSNTLSVLKLKGATLKKFLERCAEYFSINDQDEIVVNPRFIFPKVEHFNYDMVDGLDYEIDVSKPEGERIVSMSRNGKEIELDEEYTLALSNYRASGSGNFDMLKEAEVISEGQDEMVEILAQYILDHPQLIIHHKENIKIHK